MSKLEKTLNKWKNRPTLVEKEEVVSVLGRFGFDLDYKTGSHIIVTHGCLKGHPGFGVAGEFTLPIKSGRKVKGVYLKTILRAIEIIKEAG